MDRPLRIGIDFGGVLSAHSRNSTRSKEHISTTINIDSAVESLVNLREFYECELYLISYCGLARARATKEEVDKLGVFTETYFTKTKLLKNNVCRHLGIDVFIDDTLEVCINVRKNSSPNTHVIWFQGDPTFEKGKSNTRLNIIQTKSWEETVEYISNIGTTRVLEQSDVEITDVIHSL